MEDNPHFPIINNPWDKPSPMYSNQLLFRNPRPAANEPEGAHNIPQIDLSKPAKPNHLKLVQDPPRDKLFREPRSIERLIPNSQKFPKNHYIPQQREPTPKSARLFINGRVDSRPIDHTKPQIDLSKPSRKICGLQSPIRDDRPKLFQKPVEYEYTVDSPRRLHYPRQDNSYEWTKNIIPNEKKSPRQMHDIMKHDDIEKSSPRSEIDLSKPARNLDRVVSKHQKRLFEEPTNPFYVIDHPHPQARELRLAPEIQEPERPRLFQSPRPTFKYDDLDGSHPSHPNDFKIRHNPNYNSPTFKSSGFTSNVYT